MPHTLDPDAVRRWCALARESLRAACAEIDAINVFPVADGDTGTNLCLTFEAAAGAVDEAPGDSDVAGTLRAMARAALLGARGNSGTILAQYLRGMAHGLAADGDGPAPLARGLRAAADAAYEAVAHPVEGTMLTVAASAAEAAERADARDADRDGDGTRAVAVAAHEAARTALAGTPAQLAVLARAGVVDAGATGLVTLLGALAAALGAGPCPAPGPRTGPRAVGAEATGPERHAPNAREADVPEPGRPEEAAAFEVMYLIETDDEGALRTLRSALDALGDSLVIGGGDGLWSVHVHVADAGAAVEAGLAAGRPYRIRIAHLGATGSGTGCGPEQHPGRPGRPEGSVTPGPPADPGNPAAPGEPVARAVVAVVPGEGLAGLCEGAGATVVPAAGAARGETLLAAVRATGAAEAVLLPNGSEFHAAAAQAAEGAREEGVRISVIPTRAAVQGLAALAVHQPERRFDEDVVTMTSAAGATRYGEVTLAARQSWTMAGICQAGDVLGLVEGDVAVIGADIAQIAMDVLTRMLAAGGEMVTLVVGDGAPDGLAAGLESYVRRAHLAVDTVVYEGRQQASPLLIGVE